MNELDSCLLNGIKYGLREEMPRNTKAIEHANILKAIELDREFKLGIFSDSERKAIITSEKEKYLNNNPDIKKMIKKF